MPDLVTHACVAWLVKTTAGGRSLPAFVAGSFAPDLLARVPALVFTAVDAQLWPVPEVLIYGWDPLHLPAGMIPAAWLISRLFPTADRLPVFANLLGGMFLHLGLDLLQGHWGVGLALFFPFSTRTFELGWVGSESSVLVAPVLLGTCAIVARRGRRPTS